MITARHPDTLGKALRWSLTAHVVLLSVIILKGLVFPSEPITIIPTLRVDMVGLPDLLRKDLTTLPPPAAAEAKPKAQEPAKPEPKAPVEEIAKPEELVFQPKKKKAEAAKETPKKAKKDQRDQKMENALARLRALEKIQENGSDEAIVIKGNKVSPGSSLSGEAKEAAEMGYAERLRDHIAENWELPPWLARQTLTAQVQITIDATGRITSARFIRASGSAPFDDAVRAALAASQPLPVPPTEIRGAMQSAGVLLGFPL